MADVTVTYNGQNILEMSATGRKTLKTAKKRCKTDIVLRYVRPSSPGSNLRRGIGPFIGRMPEDSYPGNLVPLMGGESIQPAITGLGPSFVGYKVIVIATTYGSGYQSSALSITGSQSFTNLYTSSSQLLTVFFGTLSQDTILTNPYTSALFLIQILAISDGYTVSINNDLTQYRSSAEIDTAYIKTKEQSVGVKFPNTYGILCVRSAHDYSETTYRPCVWEPIDRFIPVPEICLRRILGNFYYTGVAAFLKVDPREYVQYFTRGSIAGKVKYQEALKRPDTAGAMNLSPSLQNWKDIPHWGVTELDIVFVEVTQLDQA